MAAWGPVLLSWLSHEKLDLRVRILLPKGGGPSHLRVLKSKTCAALWRGSNTWSGSRSSLIACCTLDQQEYMYIYSDLRVDIASVRIKSF